MLLLALALAAPPPTKLPPLTTAARYARITVGPDAVPVWVVRDGDTLHIDRNANGDLTDPGEAIKSEYPDSDSRAFVVRTVTAGGKTHRQWTFRFYTLFVFSTHPDWKTFPPVRKAAFADKNAEVVQVAASVASDRLKGGGVGGALDCAAGPLDADGPLVFGKTPDSAPTIWFDGPLTVAVEGRLPNLRVGRSVDLWLNVGTRGDGPGTFAAIGYSDCIPAGLRPVAELTPPGDTAVPERFELPDRC